eukprot:TRINITY_DN15807_c0_g2_i1.p1 TRINITY_DN15807_c0_g2~~TRINITY_DN15807_c0_g2_i1.p1  ORF type:complete len:546 (-),score=54.64 TRINITY_DN15807_c0_g2_i1:9-1574(-)
MPEYSPRSSGNCSQNADAPLATFQALLEQLLALHENMARENRMLRRLRATDETLAVDANSTVPAEFDSGPLHVSFEESTLVSQDGTTSNPHLVVAPAGVIAEQSVISEKPCPKEVVECSRSAPPSPIIKKAAWCRTMATELVSSHHFELFIFGIISCDCIMAAIKAQFRGYSVGFEIEYKGLDHSAKAARDASIETFFYIEVCIVTVYTMEVLLKLYALRLTFFSCRYNIMDLGIVVLALVSRLPNTLMSPTVVRWLRVPRLLNALRVGLNFASTDSLFMLVRTLSGCCSTLAWSFLALSIVQISAALVMTESIRMYLETTKDDEQIVWHVYSYYGTFTRTLLTMHEIFLANWAPACRVLVNNVSEYYTIFFIVYRCIFGFAVLNVVNATFVQHSMKIASLDTEVMLLRKEREIEDMANKLRSVFNQIDSSGDGRISWDEFENALSEPSIKLWMKALEVDDTDMVGLFKLVDGGDGFVDLTEFSIGIGRLRGAARSIDLAQLMIISKRLESKLGIHPHLSL